MVTVTDMDKAGMRLESATGKNMMTKTVLNLMDHRARAHGEGVIMGAMSTTEIEMEIEIESENENEVETETETETGTEIGVEMAKESVLRSAIIAREMATAIETETGSGHRRRVSKFMVKVGR